MMTPILRVAFGLFLANLAACAGAAELRPVKISSFQAMALVLAVNDSNREGRDITRCRVVITEKLEEIDVSFVEIFDAASPYQVGVKSESCGITYVVDLSGKKVKRKIYHR